MKVELLGMTGLDPGEERSEAVEFRRGYRVRLRAIGYGRAYPTESCRNTQQQQHYTKNALFHILVFFTIRL